jgi:hypothetical protein
MEELRSFQTSANVYQSARRIKENFNLQQHLKMKTVGSFQTQVTNYQRPKQLNISAIPL